MYSFGNPGNELARCNTPAVRCRNRKIFDFQCSDRQLQGILTILQCFFNRLTVGDAFRKVRVRDKKSTTFLGIQRTNFKRIISELAHCLHSFDKINKFLHVNRLDWAVGWNGKCFPICSDKNAVTATVVPPVNAVFLCHGLKLRNLPVKRVTSHGVKQLCCRIHSKMILPATAKRKCFSVPVDGANALIEPYRKATSA
jgi:hypothetical protein